MEKTLVILKPSAMLRGLAGEVISRFEKKGLIIIGMKMMTLSDLGLDMEQPGPHDFKNAANKVMDSITELWENENNAD